MRRLRVTWAIGRQGMGWGSALSYLIGHFPLAEWEIDLLICR